LFCTNAGYFIEGDKPVLKASSISYSAITDVYKKLVDEHRSKTIRMQLKEENLSITKKSKNKYQVNVPVAIMQATPDMVIDVEHLNFIDNGYLSKTGASE
jgi:stress response protein YsnF